MTTHSSARARARRELSQIKDRIRSERREREGRIEQAALTMQVALGRRAAAEAEAGEAIQTLLTEGLTWKEADVWCGGLGVSELRRLCSLAACDAADANPEVPVRPATDLRFQPHGRTAVAAPVRGELS